MSLSSIASLAVLLFLLGANGFGAQQTPQDDSLAAAQKLYSEKKWEETVQVASGSTTQSPELDYLRGMALMHLDRWQEARDAFSAGLVKAPKDSRFLAERAGAGCWVAPGVPCVTKNRSDVCACQ